MDAYQNQMKLLIHNLLLMILEPLDVSQEEMNWAISAQDSQSVLQLNSYPSCPNPSRAVGWRRVPSVEGAFVVNVGDLLHIFSNAKFPAVIHRAMVNQSEHRISVACFHGPPAESRVAPSSKFQKPCFKSLLVKEYLSLKYKHFFEALSLIRA
ncbi:putative gibberellin 3-beta-dioxygenase [Helianthus debilis subsp. tardiflorus]